MAPPPREGSSRSAGDGRLRREDSWVIDLLRKLDGCIKERAGTLFRVPEEIRKANKDKMDCYKPQFVAMGPFQRKTTIELQTMELTKWSCVNNLFHHSRNRHLLHPCRVAIEESENLIRPCDGENVEMQSEKFSMMMLQDACFLLKLLLWLYENLTSTGSPQNFLPAHIGDHKKMSRLLTDLILLENQIPFFLLIILSTTLMDGQGREEQLAARLRALSIDEQLSPEKLARSLFQCDVAHADSSKGVYHLLHLIHSCVSDPFKPQDYQEQAPLQLRRCARKLQALGIKIRRPSNNQPVEVNVEPVNTASDAVREFMDKFGFQIEFNEAQRELIIPTLHIKEATEVKWRNFIAWEQTGRLIEVGYKFTSYAYFFNGLVCSVHDVQLLREKGVITVNTGAKDEDLLIMFQSIVAGAELMDARYRQVCKRLNKAKVNGVGGCCVLILRMLWHYWQRFLEWLRRLLISLFLYSMHIYCGVPWKFIGVVSGVALLGLSITQSIYSILADAVKK